MKKILFALTTITALLLPLAPRAQAATDVSLDLFYDNLSDQGSWIEVADYGYCFQPNVAVGNANWRPYSDGYWAYTDVGWTWVSYEDFGWATYHYGRWSRLADYGWVWVPGYEWAPAWVSWRTGGDYVGWAPLPPTGERIYEGRAITGQVDVEFDIGPQYYNFVDLRYIGEPFLRDRIVEPTRNVTIISSTVNVTNITYNNSTVYNYGPDYTRLNQYSTRPIQRLSIQRETIVGANLGAQGGSRNLNRVNGNQLMVVAPTIQKSQKPIAPKQVKTRVQQPKIEHGWQGISNRQQVQAEMKKENAKNVPPPTFQPQKGRKAEAAADGQNRAAAQPNETAPGIKRNQQADRAARQGRNNGQRQKGAAETRQGDGNANANPQGGQAEAAADDQNGAAAQPNETAPGNERNQQADRAARQGRNNGQRQNGAAETRQGDGNANASPQDGQVDTRAERKAAREQKAQERSNAQKDKGQQAGQEQDESAQTDQERKVRQANRPDGRAEQGADREPTAPQGERANAGQEERPKDRQERKAEQQSPEKPDQPRARQGRQAAQADGARDAEQTGQPKHARPAQSAEQPPPAERSERPQPEQRQERAKQKQQDDQNPDASRKAKKKGQQEETPDSPQP